MTRRTGTPRGVLAVVPLLSALVALALAACGPTSGRQASGTSAGGPSTSVAPTPGRTSTTTSATGPAPSSGHSTTPASAGARATKLLVFVMENHSLAQMRAQMPWTSALADRYGYATDYHGIRHPSLPNYLAIATGGTHGVADDAAPDQHPVPGSTVFGRAVAAGSGAAVYAEGMSGPCETSSHDRYAVKHNPWAYVTSERGLCARDDLPIDALSTAIGTGTLPGAGMVVPDLCHDAHDCSLATADAWFRRWMTRVEAGPDWRAGRLVVVLTADEDDQSSGNRVLTVVAHPALHHVVVTSRLDHYALTRLFAEVTGTAPLGQADRAPSMATAFGLPVAH